MYHLPFVFLPDMLHLKHCKQQQPRTLLHCILKKFCELIFGNIAFFFFSLFSQQIKKVSDQKIQGIWNLKIPFVCKSRFYFCITPDFTQIFLFRKKRHSVCWSADG